MTEYCPCHVDQVSYCVPRVTYPGMSRVDVANAQRCTRRHCARPGAAMAGAWRSDLAIAEADQ
jgi:hypothetical protein